MKLLFKIIKSFLPVAIVFLGLLFLAASKNLPGDLRVFIVQTGSMSPAIAPGNMVLVKPAGVYQKGDVITFERLDDNLPPITHRVNAVEVQNGKQVYQTKGDANTNPDPGIVEQGNIMGKVFWNVPYFGHLLDAVRKPIGFLALIMTPAMIIIYDELLKIGKQVQAIRQRKETENVSSE